MGEELLEALRRSAVVWVGAPGLPPRAAWCAWHDDALALVTGGDEQALPGLPGADRVRVVVRGPGPLSGALAALTCDVEPVPPGSPAWHAVAPVLAARRRNGPGPDELVERWASGSTSVLRLVPHPRPTGTVVAR